MLLQQEQIQYINSITHAGKVVLFGTDNQGKVWYTVKQDGFEDSYLNTPPEQRTGWENWQELDFPNETTDDASVVAKETQEFTYQENSSQFILRSLYRTQNETAIAPVQLVSGLEHLYVFRQSKQNTLLCDRYVLDGIANTLVRKLQVRFKRIGQRFKASEKMQQGIGGLKNVDSLDYRDANGTPFYEPTTELAFIKNLHQGWFSVIQLPTVEHNKYCWNIFAYNSQTQKVDLYSLRVSEEGLFEIHDYNIFEPKSENDPTLIASTIPGIIKRTLDLNLQVGNGISATKFYVQSSRQTEIGTQLMRDDTKVMLTLVTNDNKVATINFAALGDGTLSQISNTANNKVLRSNIREVLLPLNTLEQIKTIGLAVLPPEGTITALNRTISDGIPNVQVTSPEAFVLKNGQEISIQGTNAYDGHYRISKIDEMTFEIDAPWIENGSSNNSELGIWQVLPPEEQSIVFDGIITGYEITSTGKLRVKAENHGLENGDEVQIFDTASYDGNYPITKVDDQNFTINNLRWQTGEAVNLKLQSLKRRGIVFDGSGDYIDCGSSILPDSYTKEAWIKWVSGNPQNNIISGYHSHTLFLSGGKVSAGHNNKWDYVQHATIIPTNTWIHVAVTYDSLTQTMKLYKNGQLVHSATNVPPVNISDRKIIIGAFGNPRDSFFKGSIADVRIWKVARTTEEIKNSMYLQLTGQELDLVGYWRLGGIAIDQDNQRQVIDFSANKNDGIVYGDCYVSAVTLNRKLGDGITDAVQYCNQELFAVTQQATYEETFEFKVTPTIDPNNVNGAKLFQCTYWGQKSHRSKNKISFPGNVTEIKPASEMGWYIASCHFTVPNEVNLVRCFEISDVVGTWNTLEVRKHRICKISDVITEASYTDPITLSPLGSPQEELTNQLQQKELEEQTFLKKKIELEAQLSALNAAPDQQTAIDSKVAEINSQKVLITNLEKEVSILYSAYEYEQNDLFNYWCKLSSVADANGALRIGNAISNTNSKLYHCKNKPSWEGGFQNEENQYFKFEKVSDNTYVIRCKYENLLLETANFITMFSSYTLIVGTRDDSKKSSQQWKLTRNSSGYYKLYSCSHNKPMDLDSNSTINVQIWDEWDGDNNKNQQWNIDKIGTGIPVNNNIENARLAWEVKKQELQEVTNKLAQLEQELLALQTDLTILKNRLTSEIATLANQIKEIQLQINTLNSQIMAAAQIKSAAQTMPEIASQGEFTTTGAILDFIRPASRVTALETVEGMVQLSYFDHQGKLRQGIFDATADEVNSYFEQWLPDYPPICLNCDSGTKRIDLNGSGILLNGDWTIETGFVYPLPDTSQWNTLTATSLGDGLRSTGGDRQIVIKDKKYLGTEVNQTFYYCLPNRTLTNQAANAYDMSQLSQGWHHLAVVGATIVEGKTMTSKTIFYIDGEKVGECNIKSNNNSIIHIGNIPAGGEAFGKLSEVRIWNLALQSTEILANSQVYLTGNEPGLMAYYRLNEGTGTQAQDYTGNGNNGTIVGENWWGNTKLLPDPVSQVMSFDGSGDYIALPPTNLGGAITIEVWVYNEDVQRNWHRIFDFGNGAASNNLLLAWAGTTGQLAIHSYSDSNSQGFETTEIFPNKQWVHVALTINANGNAAIYWNGVIKASGTVFVPQKITRNNCYIGKSNWNDADFQGQMAEFRIWNTARTPAEIQANMTKRLTGKETGLEVYLPLNSIYSQGTTTEVFDLAKNRHGTLYNAILTTATPKAVKQSISSKFFIDSLPLNQGISTIGGDSMITSAEYGTYDADPISKQKSAMMRRMFAYPTSNGVQVLSDKRIENLELIWIGNAQFKPTLLGYIEGSPPVPSENMNIDGDYQYNGATSVELTTTEDVEYSWNRSQDAGLGGSSDVFLGIDSETFAGIGVETQIESTRAGFKGTLDFSYQWLNESNITSSSSLVTTDRLDLRGAPEVIAQFPHFGRRFMPKNVGYALVVSGLADVFITRLSRSQKMVGHEVRPVEDIPPDVNTITFLMNPAYVMNGSLDGLVGSSAANNEFYNHVPEMRSQYGSLYPASYFRLMEAYNLKQQIEKADKERQSYFENFNSNLIDEASLNRQANQGAPLQTIRLNEGAETIDTSGQNLTEEQKQAQITQLQEEGGAKLEDLQKQGEERKQEICSRIEDIRQRTHALESFAGWQKNMENILIRSGKRNIVNTYVWDADGGLRVEEQSFANTAEHTIGGSFSLSAGLGSETDVSIFKVTGGLTALATTNMTQTMTKTQARSKGMELKVDLSGIENLGITDENDIPFQPGEKVDRFRMMSFYLEGSTDNYLDFFRYVVDPEWLASNDEEARALRQVQTGRPNKTWRVLHRVTYVERPSLMGFGRDMRSLAEIVSYSQARMGWLIPANATVLDEVKVVRDRVEYLEQENAKLQSKLDQIIDLLNNQ